jgi:hypothetical protein
MKENSKKYNATDFARYHSGAMPPDERHELEKAALEDPFLADALEGYAYSKDPRKELDEIRMRLDEKRKQQKVFSIFSLSSGGWWKIAAMFILFAGAGYFFYATNSKKEASQVVKNDATKKENRPAISPAKDDTTATKDHIAFEKPSEKNENSTAKLPLPASKSIEPSYHKKTLPGEIRNEKGKMILEGHLARNKENSVAMNNDKDIQSNIILKDSEQKTFFRSPDTTALVAVSPQAYDMDTGNTLVMNKKNATLNEVVVTGYGTQRKKNITGAVSGKLEGKVSGVTVSSASPYPKEGKENFDQYIKNNANPVFDSTGKRISANILLSFTLNRKGKPTKIKVLESFCPACEKEAVRLLKGGPNWIGRRGDSGTVRIQF